MKSTYSVKFRRKNEGKTNYNRRLKLVLSGKPRLIIRKSNKNMIAQIAEYSPKGDKIIVSANSNELKKLGWKLGTKNICAAYLTGLLLGKKTKSKGIKDAVLDIGFNTSVKGSRVYSVLKGFTEIIPVPCSEEIFPDEKRLKGEHIAKNFEQNKEKFSAYVKAGVDAKNIVADIEKIKQKITEKK